MADRAAGHPRGVGCGRVRGDLRRMRRFFVRPEDVEPTELRLMGAEALHLRRVLRLQAGAHITAFDGVGHEYEAVVEELTDDAVRCHILQMHAREPAEGLSIIL